jgi:hypothetical protein
MAEYLLILSSTHIEAITYHPRRAVVDDPICR